MIEAVLLREQYTALKDQFYHDVLSGLSGSNKTLHPKYFYDKKGSEYFDQICELEEYYPYKTELTLLPRVAKDVAGLLKDEYALIEFGAGSLLKVKPFLQKVRGIKKFVPIDISGEHLRDACNELAEEFRDIDIAPIAGDFSQPLDLPPAQGLKNIGFFPGSTIGNFTPEEAKEFLSSARATLGDNNYLIVGVDTKKSPKKLHRAYNDQQGVTARFNLNILTRINQHFDSEIDDKNFEHYAYYNAHKGCIEMHLVCLQKHSVYLDDVCVDFQQGESIHTESSYKYSPKDFQALAQNSGWHVEHVWMAEDDMFSIYLLRNSVS